MLFVCSLIAVVTIPLLALGAVLQLRKYRDREKRIRAAIAEVNAEWEKFSQSPDDDIEGTSYKKILTMAGVRYGFTLDEMVHIMNNR